MAVLIGTAPERCHPNQERRFPRSFVHADTIVVEGTNRLQKKMKHINAVVLQTVVVDLWRRPFVIIVVIVASAVGVKITTPINGCRKTGL